MTQPDLAQIEAERRRVEEELRRTCELLRAVADGVSDAIYVKDPSGKYLLFNNAASRLTGKSTAEVLGRDDTAIFDGDSVRVVMEGDRRVMMAGVAETKEVELTAGGVTRIYLSTKAPYRDEQGKIVGVIGIARDITERKRADEQSRVTAERLHAVIAAAPMVIWALDRNGIKTLSVGKLLEKWGRKDNEMVGRSIFEAAKDVPEMLDAARRVLKGESLSGITTAENRTFEWWYYPLRGDGGAMTGAIGVAIDVTAQKQAENALRQSERLMRQVLNALPVGVIVTNLSGNVILSNPASQRIWDGIIIDGPERYAKSMGWWHGTEKRIGPEEWASVRAFTIGEASSRELIDIETFDGVRKIIENSAAPIRDDDQTITGAVVINEDVTDVVRLEDQLRQSQKMEAIGHLAAGVAHDFNNLLTIIFGSAELLREMLPSTDPKSEMIPRILQAAERAAGLTRQLLAFSRQTVLEPRVLDLNVVVRENEKMLRPLIGEDVQLTVVLEPALKPVRIDPGQIAQVIMNLAVNARDAMPTGGKLMIETSNVQLDKAFAAAHPGVKPGHHVLLAVTDTGTGMTSEVQSQIFEPFFTIKGPGKGTGLGLATVYGIVKQSGGFIDVDSELGWGTAFKLYFPTTEEIVPPEKSLQDANPTAHGSETILVVEDEDAVRSLLCMVLQEAGYRVLEASRGAEAIRLFEQHSEPIQLVVTDVVMPEMGGRQMVQRLSELRPDLRVLYLSGYTDDAVVRHGVLQANVAFLQKPFTMATLTNKVRQVLDLPARPSSFT
jgi:PAS domain S-box-containing protein